MTTRPWASDPLGFIVENQAIRAALLARAGALAALRHLAPASVEALETTAGGIDARLADGRCLRARLAVAADGANSGLRAAAGIETVRWSYEQTGIVCTVEHERPHRGIAHERFLPAGPFAILPMTGNRSSLVWTERAALAPALMEASPAVFARELGTRFGDFLGALEPTGPRWSYPLNLTHAKRYVAPRLALAGDAAHAIHPLAGQGFNLGIRDAAMLAELVVDRARLGLDIGDDDVLVHYQRRRRFDSVVLIGVTDGLNRLFSNDSQGLAPDPRRRPRGGERDGATQALLHAPRHGARGRPAAPRPRRAPLKHYPTGRDRTQLPHALIFSRSAGRETPTSPRPSPPPRAERE